MYHSLDYFIKLVEQKVPFAVSRFNDGEISAILGSKEYVSRGDQEVSDGLGNKLKEALMYRQKNYYVGLPDDKFKEDRRFAEELVGDYKNLTSSVIFHDKNWPKFMANIKHIASYFDSIVWVGGLHHRVDNLPFSISKHTLTASKNSFKNHDVIKDIKIPGGSLVFLSCGPLGRILTKEWFEKHPDSTFMEIGSSLDPFVQGIRRPYQKRQWESIKSIVREW